MDVGSWVWLGPDNCQKYHEYDDLHERNKYLIWFIGSIIHKNRCELWSRGLADMRFAHIMNWNSVLCDDISHLLDLLFQFCNVVIILSYCCFSLVELFLKNLFLWCHSFQLLAQRLCSCLKLLSFLDEILEFKFVLHEVVLLDLLFSLELLPVLSELLELIFLSFAFTTSLILSFLSHLKLMLETILHLLSRLSLTLDSGILFLQLITLSPQFLAGGLSVVMKNFSLGDLGCKLVEDFFILH